MSTNKDFLEEVKEKTTNGINYIKDNKKPVLVGAALAVVVMVTLGKLKNSLCCCNIGE